MKQKKKANLSSKWGLYLSLLIVLFDLFFQYDFRQKGIGVGNSGVSFGLFSEWDFFWVLGILAVLVLIFLARENKSNIYLKTLIFGGLGNLSSRFLFGNVWDYINLSSVGLWVNMSDILISLSAISFILGRNDDRNTL